MMAVTDGWLLIFLFLTNPLVVTLRMYPLKLPSLVTGREHMGSCKEAVPTLFLDLDAGQIDVFTL